MGTWDWAVLAAAGALALGCGRPGAAPEAAEPPPRPVPPVAEGKPGTLVIEGSHDGDLRYAAREFFALGADIEGAREEIAASGRTVLLFDGTARPELLASLVRAFRETHGFWQEIALSERDPDAGFEGCEATVSLDKSSCAADEPVLLTIDVSRDVDEYILTPEHVRIVDSRGEAVNVFARSLGGGHLYLAAANSVSTRTFDLTSFITPPGDEEYVWRFAPGRYSATFHFSVGRPEWREPFDGVKELGPRVWGRKTGNTVSFEVRETPSPSPERVRAMLDAAARLAAEARALDPAAAWAAKAARTREAVDALKRVIVSSSDFAAVLEAVRRIEAVRADRDLEPDAPPDPDAVVLALANASEEDRRAACERYVRAWRKDMRGEADPAERELVRGFPFRSLFEREQFRPILEEQVRREAVEWPYAEAYLWLPGAKDAAVMARLLPQYPSRVLEHYAWRKAPPEAATLFPGYFESEEPVLGSDYGVWLCADAALQAFELAAGLDLGYRGRADRIRDREHIAAILGRWWRRNGATLGADGPPAP